VRNKCQSSEGKNLKLVSPSTRKVAYASLSDSSTSESQLIQAVVGLPQYAPPPASGDRADY